MNTFDWVDFNFVGMALAAIAIIALWKPYARVSGLLFRARGGWDGLGFSGKTKGLTLFVAWVTLPWALVGLWALWGSWGPYVAAYVAVVALSLLGTSTFGHGSAFDLGESIGHADRRELPHDLFTKREQPGWTEEQRISRDSKAAAIRIGCMSLPIGIAGALAAHPLFLLGALLGAISIRVVQVAVATRLDPAKAEEVRREFRLTQPGFNGGWEILEFLAGWSVALVSLTMILLVLAYHAAASIVG